MDILINSNVYKYIVNNEIVLPAMSKSASEFYTQLPDSWKDGVKDRFLYNLEKGDEYAKNEMERYLTSSVVHDVFKKSLMTK